MRMTASWLDPALGSAEYKDVARDLCAPPWQARLRSSCLCSLKRNATGPPRACRRARAGQEVAWKRCRTLNGLSDGHP